MHSPSAQLAAHYDGLAALESIELVLLFRKCEQGNPAWTPKLPERWESHFLPRHRLNRLPGRIGRFFLADVWEMLERQDFDALIIHGFYSSAEMWTAIRWCRLNSKPYLILSDANIAKESPGLRTKIKKLLIRRNLRDAAGVLVIGTQNRKFYELYGGRAEQFFLAPWEIDYQTLEAALKHCEHQREEIRHEIGLAEQDVAIITVGRVIKRKGFQEAIRAVGELSSNGRHVRFLIAGEGEYQGELDKLTARLKAPVTLCGNLNRADLVRTMVASDIFVLPSHWEPWGLVVNEACLCGLPLVLSDQVGAGEDLLVPGENGYVFPTGDVGALVNVLSKLVENPELRRSMARRSRQILDRWRRENPAIKGYRAALEQVLQIES